jgi:hypothetical protein
MLCQVHAGFQCFLKVFGIVGRVFEAAKEVDADGSPAFAYDYSNLSKHLLNGLVTNVHESLLLQVHLRKIPVDIKAILKQKSGRNIRRASQTLLPIGTPSSNTFAIGYALVRRHHRGIDPGRM